MVGLGMLFLLIFILVLYFLYKKDITKARWLNYIALWAIPLAYIAQQSGWMVAEFGRQPWVVQNLMTTLSAVSNINYHSVITTFIIFAITFTVLLIAEIKIMLKQIVIESKIEED
jgi:cytochrome d ubiquinol oxidase subunit I